jgi:hypothetical protein
MLVFEKPRDLIAPKRPVTIGGRGSSPASCDGSLTASSVGIHTIYSCELLRVAVRVILGAMQGYVRRFDHRSVSVEFPRLSHRINALTRIL